MSLQGDLWQEQTREYLQMRLQLLESDLKNLHSPEVQARWPNLGVELLAVELRARIAEVNYILVTVDV